MSQRTPWCVGVGRETTHHNWCQNQNCNPKLHQSHKHAGLNSVSPRFRESQATAGCEGQLSVMVPGRGVGSYWTLRVGLLRSLREAVSRGSSQKHWLLCWLNLKAVSRHRGQSLSAKTCYMYLSFKIFIYAFIWLNRVLVAARRIFVAAPRLLPSCGVWAQWYPRA